MREDKIVGEKAIHEELNNLGMGDLDFSSIQKRYMN